MINHIAIIPDGNRRWAKQRNLPTLEGHRRGFDVAIKIAKKIRSLGVSTMTIWAFSTENWKRTTEEVSYLMKLYELLLEKSLEDAIRDEVRIIHLGRKDRLPDSLLKKILKIEEQTKKFNKYFLNIALDYGGRDEILRSISKIKNLKSKITENQFDKALDTGDQPHPNPDIVIRTSGEMRTSGLMIWQAVYAEWFFLEKYFPDLNDQDVENVIEEYNLRQRRFGS